MTEVFFEMTFVNWILSWATGIKDCKHKLVTNFECL